MRAVVLSLHPLTERERRRVAGILQEPGNHRKALRAAFPERFRSMDDTTRRECPRIYFDSDAAYEQTEILTNK